MSQKGKKKPERRDFLKYLASLPFVPVFLRAEAAEEVVEPYVEPEAPAQAPPISLASASSASGWVNSGVTFAEPWNLNVKELNLDDD